MTKGSFAIVGGTAGIGLEVARRLVDRGENVLVGGRSSERATNARHLLGSAALIKPVDCTDRESLARFFEGCGPLKGLVTLGSAKPAPSFRNGETEAVNAVFTAKFWGQYWAIHQALPYLAEEAGIVAMAGVASVKPMGSAAYTACNAAIEGLVRALAVELAPVRVNCISPGIIDSELWRSRPESQRSQAYADWKRQALVGRVGTVEDAAEAVLFLLDNANMSGATIYSDGGASLR